MGGHRDLARTLPWERDTIVNVWSTTKMFTSMCVLMLHDRGALSLDAPMADYWPEFAANGKEEVLVRHVMAHTAGLSAFDGLITDLDEIDWDACCARLASQAPRWTPGHGSGYHAETRGWLLGELVRWVDGRTLGEFFRDEVAEPLGIDAHIGLADTEFRRVADMSTYAALPYSNAADEHGRRPPVPGPDHDRTFWWAGWGGSMCVVDVENRLTVAYAMNKMEGEGEMRAAMIVMAAHSSGAAM